MSRYEMEDVLQIVWLEWLGVTEVIFKDAIVYSDCGGHLHEIIGSV